MSIFLDVRIDRECSGRGPGFRKLGLCQECVDNVPAVRPRQVSLREVNSRIVGTATIVNTSNAAVRSTTGSLSLGRRAGGNATGVLTFSAGSLPPHGSSTMRLRTARVGTLLAGSGRYSPLICTDIYSQIQRFATDTHCTRGAKLTITAISHTQSGPAPNTILKTPVAKLSRSSTMVLRFGSTTLRSTFQCRLDGGPWLTCRSPQGYSALVDGAHVFQVRALSPTGGQDPAPARASSGPSTGPFRR